jgi:two-component system chemotaxis response regulator CheB
MNELVVIGGSAGSFRIATELLACMKKNNHRTVVVCLHRWKEKATDFVKTLTVKASAPAQEITDKMTLLPGRIYVAPSNYHVYLSDSGNFILTNEEEYSFSRPSIDICFSEMARVYKEKVTAILLSGANNDGAEGISAILSTGGKALIQIPSECEISVMTEAAIEINPEVTVLPVSEIKKYLSR